MLHTLENSFLLHSSSSIRISILNLTINTVFNCFFTDHAHLHRRCQRRGHACVAIMSLVWSYVCGFYPTLSPSIQVPCALDPVRVGCRHLYGHPSGVSIGSTNPSSHQPPVYTTQLSRDLACVPRTRLGSF